MGGSTWRHSPAAWRCMRLEFRDAALAAIGLLMLATTSEAQAIAAPAVTVASASGDAAAASIGGWLASDSWSFWTVQGWYAYFPGTIGIDTAGVEIGLISPVRGAGAK